MRFPSEGAARRYMDTVDPRGVVQGWRTMRYVDGAERPVEMPHRTPVSGGGGDL